MEIEQVAHLVSEEKTQYFCEEGDISGEKYSGRNPAVQ